MEYLEFDFKVVFKVEVKLVFRIFERLEKVICLKRKDVVFLRVDFGVFDIFLLSCVLLGGVCLLFGIFKLYYRFICLVCF